MCVFVIFHILEVQYNISFPLMLQIFADMVMKLAEDEQM